MFKKNGVNFVLKKDTIKYKEIIIKNWPNISLAKIDDINSIGWRDTNTKQKKAIFLLFLIKKDILYIKVWQILKLF